MQSWVQSAGQNDTFAFNFTLGICTRAYTGTPVIHTNMSTHDKQPAYSFTYAFTNNHGACVAARECAKRCHKRDVICGTLRHSFFSTCLRWVCGVYSVEWRPTERAHTTHVTSRVMHLPECTRGILHKQQVECRCKMMGRLDCMAK